MTLLLFCMTIMRAPTMPSPDSADAGGAGLGSSVTCNTQHHRRTKCKRQYALQISRHVAA